MEDKVVLRYRDGRTDRVSLDPIEPARELLTVRRDDGSIEQVPFSQLKAVFFPRLSADEPEPPAGLSLSVEFSDGEVIIGTAQYNPEKNGFFLHPQDRSKIDRIFVVNSAITSIEVS